MSRRRRTGDIVGADGDDQAPSNSSNSLTPCIIGETSPKLARSSGWCLDA